MLVEEVHALGYRFALRSDGAMGELLPEMVGIGIDILHPLQTECVDVKWVKREFGREVTIWGGYGNQRTLARGTPHHVRNEMEATCDILGAGGCFILSPGLGWLMDGMPLENAVAFVEVAKGREGLGWGPD
jgi:uroporphyrinogen decarboxylase